MNNYKLYITRLTDKALDAFAEEMFTRATKDYLLIYTDNDIQSESVIEIPPEVAKERLTRPESMWLTKCCVDIINSELIKKTPQVIDIINQKVDALEKALEAERERATEGEADAEQLE